MEEQKNPLRRSNSVLPNVNLSNVVIINKEYIQTEDLLDDYKQIELDVAKNKIDQLGQYIYCFELQYTQQLQQEKNKKQEVNNQTWWIRKRVHDFLQLKNEVESGLMEKLNYYLHEKQIESESDQANPTRILALYEDYLKNLLKQKDHDENAQRKIRQFIELSYVNYHSQKKFKEAYFKKKAGGRYGESRCRRCGVICGFWNERLFIITSEAVMYATNSDSDGAVIREVLSFDANLQILHGLKQTGDEFGITIKTMTRVLQMKTTSLWSYIDFLARLWEAYSSSPYIQQHRFVSSSPVRQGLCRWFISGAEYFALVFQYLKKAKRTVYITDWWLSPEFYLKRPVGVEGKNKLNRESRLDLVLKDIADRGVQVFIIVYQEPTLALNNDSLHTQNHLESLSLNIHVQRHPSQPTYPLLWSHHEKMVVIDHKYGFMGGLDLCFGRMDTKEHHLFDMDYEETLGTQKENEFWPGIDYSNSRKKDFFNVKTHHTTLLPNKRAHAKMPWQDIAIFIQGDAVIDLERHFVQYWNFTTIDNNFDKRIGGDMLLQNQGPQKEQDEIPWTQRVKEFFSKVDHTAYKELDDKKDKKDMLESQFIKQLDANQIVQQIEQQIEAQEEEEENKDQPRIDPSQSILLEQQEEETKQQNKILTSQYIELGQEQQQQTLPQPKQKLFTSGYDYSKKRHTDITGITGISQVMFSANLGRKNQFNGSIIKAKMRVSMVNPQTESSPIVSKGIKREYLEIMKAAAQIKKTDINQWLKQEKQSLSLKNQKIDEQQYERRAAIRHNDVLLENFTPFLQSQPSSDLYERTVTIPHQQVYSKCQFIRSASRWSIGLQESYHEQSIHFAYIELIAKAKQFIFIENQFFISSSAGKSIQNQVSKTIVTRIKQAAANKEQFKVIIFVPLLPGFEGEIDDPSSAVLKVQLHWEYSTISRGGTSILEQLRADPNIEDPSDYIQFYSLRQHQKDPLTGIPQTEIIYIHSKLLIIDDDIALIGSANINDRSLLGMRDSEIAMVIEDEDKVLSTMGGVQSEHSKFAHTLRTNLYISHFGLTPEQAEDPLNSELQLLINFRTQQNTQIYRQLFYCYPDDNIMSLQDYANVKNKQNLDKYDELAPKIVGQAVEFPLKFLQNENLKIKITQKEYLCPEENFT